MVTAWLRQAPVFAVLQHSCQVAAGKDLDGNF
jgi:hypothetical protein